MKLNEETNNIGIASATVNVANPSVGITPVTDPIVIDQQQLFLEAKTQCESLLKGKTYLNGKNFLTKNTARTTGLTNETVTDMLNRNIKLSDLAKGANPQGKVKEVVASYEYRKMQSGDSSGIINAPKHNSPSVKGIRLSPDPSSRRDLIFEIDIGNDRLILVPGGQVKTGSAKYVADSLAEMSKKAGYGKTAIIDARFVNPDGSSRVASDAFTQAQAKKIQESGVRLRGVKDLDRRGDELLRNINRAEIDGLDPLSRKELHQLQIDIAKSYEGKAFTGRVASGAAIAFASAAILSMIVQYSTNQKIDIKPVIQSGGQAAVYGGTGVLADGVLYRIGTEMGKSVQEAKSFAQQGVTAGFCLFAVAADAVSEIYAYKNGELTLLNSVSGSAIKIAIDILPILTAPLGLLGIPICLGAQISGRWIISRIRAGEAKLKTEIQEVLEYSKSLDLRISAVIELSNETDIIFNDLGLSYKTKLKSIK